MDAGSLTLGTYCNMTLVYLVNILRYNACEWMLVYLNVLRNNITREWMLVNALSYNTWTLVHLGDTTLANRHWSTYSTAH